MKVLIDNANSGLISKVLEGIKSEKGRRLPIHSMHRWWSRRFSSIYRFILSTYLFDDLQTAEKALHKPEIMREKAKELNFVEPFVGGGTGVSEAALSGWSVYGVDINPVATSVSKASLSLVTQGLPKNFKNDAIKTLDKTLSDLKNLWSFDGKYASYIFISRDKAPTRLSVKDEKGRKIPILLCPNCLSVFKSNNIESACPFCKHRFKADVRGSIELNNSFPEEHPGWRAFAVEFRDSKNKWEKEYVSLAQNREVKSWLSDSLKEAEEICDTFLENINSKIDVKEHGKLQREASIEDLYQLFTKRQLASFYTFSNNCKRFKNKEKLSLLALALSESTKASTLLAKWHAPLAEPVPAGAMKTHWVPKHTVESNPLAHMINTIRPLGRNTIASALHAQVRANEFTKKNGGPSGSRFRIVNGDAEKVDYPKKIDLVVVDPPYMDAVKSYTSLSLIHYAGLKLFDSVNGSEYSSDKELKEVESIEIPRRKKEYEEKVYKVFNRLYRCLHKNSRIVLMYNRLSVQDWLPILRAAKESGLYPRAIYWIPGESPGGLARSKLRGIYLIVLGKEKTNSINIQFENVINEVDTSFSIDVDTEFKSFEALKDALESTYSDVRLRPVHISLKL